ncbi:hypothetical protein YC2023_118589 [Brassica napus]
MVVDAYTLSNPNQVHEDGHCSSDTIVASSNTVYQREKTRRRVEYQTGLHPNVDWQLSLICIDAHHKS